MIYDAYVELSSMGVAAADDNGDGDVSRLSVHYLTLPRSKEYNLKECVT